MKVIEAAVTTTCTGDVQDVPNVPESAKALLLSDIYEADILEGYLKKNYIRKVICVSII